MTIDIESLTRSLISAQSKPDLLPLYDILLHGGKREFLELKSNLRTCLLQDGAKDVGLRERMRAADFIRGAVSSLPATMMALGKTIPLKAQERIRSLAQIMDDVHDRLLMLFSENVRENLPPILRWKRHGYNLTLLLKALIATGCVEAWGGGRVMEQDFIRLIGHAVGVDLSLSTIKNSRQYLIAHCKDPSGFFLELASWCDRWMDEHLVLGRYQRHAPGRTGERKFH